MSLGTPIRILNFTTAQVKYCKVSPFLVGMPCILQPAAGAASTVYRAYHPGTTDTARYARFVGDGSTVTFTMPSALTAMPVTVDASITDALRMQIIVLINGSPIVRKGTDATPGAGEFKSASSTTITFGSTYASGTKIEVFVLSASGDIAATAALAAGSQTEEPCRSFYTASAPVTLSAVGHP
jgi:hypothetical protein